METVLGFHNHTLYGTHRLLITLVVVLVLIQQIFASSPSQDMQSTNKIRHVRHKQADALAQLQRSRTTSYLLHNDCSRGYMDIDMRPERPDEIGARNQDGDGRAYMEFVYVDESLNSSSRRFYIKRSGSENYICFSKRGKLIVKKSVSRDDACKFMEEPISSSDNLNIRIKSVANEEWYIGFNKIGAPLKGWEFSRRHYKHCFKFLRSSTPYSDSFRASMETSKRGT